MFLVAVETLLYDFDLFSSPPKANYDSDLYQAYPVFFACSYLHGIMYTFFVYSLSPFSPSLSKLTSLLAPSVFSLPRILTIRPLCHLVTFVLWGMAFSTSED